MFFHFKDIRIPVLFNMRATSALAAFMTMMVSLVSARQMERIFNGKNATQGQFPYQVSWQMCFDSIGRCLHFCGGSIFNKTTIITAAHCCDRFGKPDENNNILQYWSDSIIVAGAFNLRNLQEESRSVQFRKIEDLIIHPQYRSKLFESNDICLLTLELPLEFNQYVRPIYLDKKKPVVGTKCLVSGWGDKGVSAKYVRTYSFFSYLHTFLEGENSHTRYFTQLSSMDGTHDQVKG